MDELWKPIAGYEALYEVSNYGRVKSLARTCLKGTVIKKVRERILRPTLMSVGYLKVALSRDGIVCQCYVHRLVAEAFLPNPLGLPEVNHKDSCRSNSYFENLEWTTSAGNSQHAVANDRMARGAGLPQSKLTPDKVRMIRAELAAGATQQATAKRYGITQSTLSALALGRTWRHVK